MKSLLFFAERNPYLSVLLFIIVATTMMGICESVSRTFAHTNKTCEEQ